MRFRYTYIAGGPYKGEGRVEQPGPNGFQVCAEADLEPGGDTTLLCQSGIIDETLGMWRVRPEREEHLE